VFAVVQSDLDLLKGIDDDGDFESHQDEPEAESVKRSEVFRFGNIVCIVHTHV